MFESLPRFFGKALDGVRAGPDKLLLNEEAAHAPETIEVSSLAFVDGGAVPIRFTADGDGVSPPLAWTGLPTGTAEVLVVVEDPDAPTPHPIIHLIAVFPANSDGVGEGALNADRSGVRLGKNSFGKSEWLPCDPPPGHGPHHYLFQVFALGRTIDWDDHPGKDEVKAALEDAVIGKGVLVATYERG